MKKKFLKFIAVLYAVSIPVVTAFGGFFHAMRSFDMAFGCTPRPPHEAFIMDALTAPVQLFVFTPFVVAEFVNSRTGERGRLRREQQRESDAYKAIDKDFDSIWNVPEFWCETNTPQKRALARFLAYSPQTRLSTQQVSRVVREIRHSPCLTTNFCSVVRQCAISNDDLGWFIGQAKNLHDTGNQRAADELISSLSCRPALTDSQLDSLLAAGMSREVYDRIRRERDRELERQRKIREAEEIRRRALLQEEKRMEAYRLKCELEERKKAEAAAHLKAIQPLVQGIYGDSQTFGKALEHFDDPMLRTEWSSILSCCIRPFIPVSNLIKLLDAIDRLPPNLLPCDRHIDKSDVLRRRELPSDFLEEQLKVYVPKGGYLHEARAILSNPSLPKHNVISAYSDKRLAYFRALCANSKKFRWEDEQARKKFMMEFHRIEKKHKGPLNAEDIEELDGLLRRMLPPEPPEWWVKLVRGMR